MAGSKQVRRGRPVTTGGGGISYPGAGQSAEIIVTPPSGTYESALAQASRIPCYFIEFQDTSITTTRFGTHSEMGFSNMSYLMLDAPDRLEASVYPEDGRSSFQNVTVSLIDANGAITAIVGSIDGAIVTLRAGFVGIPEAEFISFPVGLVEDVYYRDGIYSLVIRDPLSRLNKDICPVSATALSGALTDSATTVPCDDASDFGASGYIVIDSEIIQYTGTTSTSFTGCTRGVLRTTAASHSDDALIREGIYYLGHPADIALEWITGTGKRGAAVDTALVDTNSFDEVKTALDPTLQMEWFFTSRVDAINLIESEFCRAATAYMTTDTTGRIAVQDLRHPLTVDSVASIDTASNVLPIDVSPVQFSRRRNTRVNRVVFRHSPDLITGSFFGSIEFKADGWFEDDDWPRFFDVTGLQSHLPGFSDFMSSRAAQVFQRYEDNATKVTLRLLMSEHLRKAGEVITLTHPDLPDVVGGTVGVSGQAYEIIRRSVVFPKKDGAGGYVEVDLLSYGGAGPTTVISDLAIEYGSADADQQADYAWILDSGSYTIGL